MLFADLTDTSLDCQDHLREQFQQSIMWALAGGFTEDEAHFALLALATEAIRTKESRPAPRRKLAR